MAKTAHQQSVHSTRASARRRSVFLEEIQARLAAIVESSDDAIISKSLKGVITSWNQGAERIFGWTASEAVGRHITMLIPLARRAEETQILRRLRRGERIEHFETVRMRKDGRRIDVSITVSPVRNRAGKVIGASKIARDVTDRKLIEQRLRRSLKEKELLLNEIHHRVKNNLQVISSLISLQSDAITDRDTLAIFRESQNRIRSMALVHEKLYETKSFSRVPFGDYLRDLVEHLRFAYPLAGNIDVRVDAEDVGLGIDLAIPCGLIVNELAANSMEHAFPGTRAGKISIVFGAVADDLLQLTVKDDGVGLPPGFVIGKAETLGLRLVAALVEQIQGELTLTQTGGTRIDVLFKTEIAPLEPPAVLRKR